MHLHDVHSLRRAPEGEGGGGEAGGCGLSIPFVGLHDAFVASLHAALASVAAPDHAAATVLLLYMTLQANHSFLHFVLAKSDPETLLAPLLAMLYSYANTPAAGASAGGSDPLTSASTYILLVVLLILTNDGIYCGNLHTAECSVGNVEWYKQRVLSNISMGSLAVVVLIRTLQSNLRHQDAYISRNSLYVLSNMAPHFSALHPYAAQRLVYLFEVLSKRSIALANRLRPQTTTPNTQAPVGGGDGDGGEGGEMSEAVDGGVLIDSALAPSGSTDDESLGVCMELRTTTLELFRLSLTHGVTRNPHLIYALMHKRQVFEKYQDAGVFSHLALSPASPETSVRTERAAAEAAALHLIFSFTNFFATHVEVSTSLPLTSLPACLPPSLRWLSPALAQT